MAISGCFLIQCLCLPLIFIPLHAENSAGTNFDLQSFIDKAVAAGETHIKIPIGRHRVAPASNDSHLTLRNLHNVVIDGTGAEMICTHTTRAITIMDCENLTISGLIVDYDPLNFTQGRITQVSRDKRILTIDLMQGYPDSDRATKDKLEVYSIKTGELVTNTYYNVHFSENGPRQVIATKPKNYRPENALEQVGDIAVITSKEKGSSAPHAIHADNCSGLVMQNVTLYGSNSFGFFETDCSGSKYVSCVVDRRPIEDDIQPREHRRMRSLTADGFHSKHAPIGPSFFGCVSRYNGDDGIAINGHYHILTTNDGPVFRVVGKQGREPNLSVGDVVELVSYTGERTENATIKAIEHGPALTDEEKQFLKAQRFNGNVQSTRQATHVHLVTLDRDVDLPFGSLIASANRIGNGFEIRNCTLGPNRSRGLVVKASDGVISGNQFIDNWGQAIKLAPEYAWLEAGSGSNVTISDNSITGCRDAAIAIYAYGGNGSAAPAGAHNDIRIIDNSISSSTNPAIAVTSTRGLTLHNNKIQDPENSGLAPWIRNRFSRNQDPDLEIYLDTQSVTFGK